MEKLRLVTELIHPVVECYDLAFDIHQSSGFEAKPGYATDEGKNRYLDSGEVTEQVRSYFENLIYHKIVPLLFSHKNFFHTWPIVPKTVLDNTKVNIAVFKDEIGWQQGLHEDPKVFFLSGVLHMQDCEQGTTFIDKQNNITYQAPVKKYSGAFWLNSHYSHHYVEKVTKERMGYLIIMPWTCFEPYNFSGDSYGAGGSFMIDFEDFYK